MYPIVIIFVILMYTHVFMISYVAKNKLNWIELNNIFVIKVELHALIVYWAIVLLMCLL